MRLGGHGGLIFVSWCCVAALAGIVSGCKRKPTDTTHDASVLDASTAPATSAATSSSTTTSVDAGPKIASDLNLVVISVDSLRGDMPWNGYARPIEGLIVHFDLGRNEVGLRGLPGQEFLHG